MLFAKEEHPQLEEMIARAFSNPGDGELAYKWITEGRALQKTEDLAREYRDKAAANLACLKDSEFKGKILELISFFVERGK